ncbi:LysR family transcriptional regulator [Parasphingorhabdus sp.]|uniref:LysR substrate-binding domain-containing protein n=1 Tax=Parasphingorhabdus sp. TaxID=2709688 RepID=UPI002F94233F
MSIEIKQLRYAIAAADTKSFSRAAAALNVKQSTLSKRIALLEGQLGITLFERTTRGAIPTETGNTFLEVARRIITDVDNLKTTARSVQYGEVGRMVIGFSSSLSTGHLHVLLGDYLNRFPDLQLDGVEAGTERLLSGIQSRIIDIAIHAGEISDIGISKRSLWSEKLMLALPENHPLLETENIHWTDLQQEIFVLPSRYSGSVIADLLDGRMAVHGYKANIITQETGHDNILGMVPFGKFITLVGESALGAARPRLAYREISELGGHAHLDISAYWRDDNENPALKRFFKLINERYPEAVGLT